jgi:transketolase
MMNSTEAGAQITPAGTKVASSMMDQLCINAIRTLAMDAVQAANSGHPGTPMALAPVVYCLWQRVLRYDPDHPIWPHVSIPML